MRRHVAASAKFAKPQAANLEGYTMRLLALPMCAFCIVLPLCGDDAPTPAPKAKTIDLVLCLDVSGSMNGLIDSAKHKLWDVVNDLAKIQPAPNLRVALYSYGGTGPTYTPQS